jgi:hypothetical protein
MREGEGTGMGASQAGKTVAMSQRPTKNKKNKTKKAKGETRFFS